MACSQECVALGERRACRLVLVPKARCTNGIAGIMLAGNTNASPGAQSGWFCPLPTSLLALWDVPLTASLKAGRCEVLLPDLALLLFSGKRPKGGELPEDNSSSAGASASSRSMGSFPRLRGTGCKDRPLSCTYFPLRSNIFSI